MDKPEDNNPGDGNQDDKNKGQDDNKPVGITQERVQELINEAFGKGAAKVEKEKLGPMEQRLTDALSTVEALQKQVEELKPKKSGGAGDGHVDDDNKDDKSQKDGRTREAKLLAQIEEINAAFKTVQAERDTLKAERESAVKASKTAAFNTAFDEAAGEFKFFKNGTVRLELGDQLQYNDDGGITVLNPRTGQPRLNSEMQPFTLKDLLAEYAKNNPHMVKVEVNGGSDSRETRKLGDGNNTKSIKDMTADEIKQLEQRVRSGEVIKL